MKIVCASDLHQHHNRIEFPKGDMLLLGGDYDIRTEYELDQFNFWLGSLGFKYIIVVAGNHDFYFEKNKKEKIKEQLINAIYLEHEYIELEGIKIFGSPWTPKFFNWAFMYARCSLEAKQLWEGIPENIDILITHGPCYQILDQNRKKETCGCEVLQREVFKKKPKHHIFGHIHPDYDIREYKLNDTYFHNVSLVNEDYKLSYDSTIIQL